MLRIRLILPIFLFSVALFGLSASGSEAKHVNVIEINGVINPIAAKFITEAIDQSEEDGAQCLIIQMDTPGGLMDSMRTIVKKLLSARVPTVVYVSPSGARAASAGVFITMAAHIAAMAPSTNIGAAHPVTLGSQQKENKAMMEKVVNDAVAQIKGIAKKRGRNVKWAEKAVRKSVSITEGEALKLKVIDLVAPDLDSLLAKLDGRTVKIDSEKKVLVTKGTSVNRRQMGWRYRFLDIISNPTIAYIMLMLGIYGIFFELSNPGAILPGVLGAIFLILAFFALQMLPINYAGLALILLGIILFIAEVKITSYGMLSVGGAVCMLLGSIMLAENLPEYMKISKVVIIPAVLVSAGFFLFAVTMAIRARRKKPTTGVEGLIGEVGVSESVLAPEGTVSIHGELWRAECDEWIEKGKTIKVVGVDNLKLKVKKV
ncbi:MAG: nodulation protein NfeD [Syntrophobacterales bacterium]|nr:MAG: nodulation protein NfeD [Syntrophobacterales bacterium]